MVNIVSYENESQILHYLKRPSGDFTRYREQVAPILEDIRLHGDIAVKKYAQQWDSFTGDSFLIPEGAIAQAGNLLTADLRAAIQQAYQNIRTFHASQCQPELGVETMPGVFCFRKSVPVEKVGLYIPGGTAPLFSTVLMLGVPAQLAGCAQVVLCTPANGDQQIHPAILFAAELCGIRQIFGIGGAQAIGAMAYGTETIPQVWKIFGPGNPWVTAAKQLVALDGIAIDMPAGPSEVAIIADEAANPLFIAADLLSQAEHGSDSQVVFISPSEPLFEKVQHALNQQIQNLERKSMAEASLANSRFIRVKDLHEAIKVSNLYAPEHLILQVEAPEHLIPFVINAGSVFLGHYTPESAGDYASGTNHTLPTNGHARSYSGVSVDSFVKKITFQHIRKEGLSALSETIISMANAEGLTAHAMAVQVRTDSFKD